MRIFLLIFILSLVSITSRAQFEDFRSLLSKGQAQFLKPSEIQKLYDFQISHPVARTDRINFYDPEGLIGFCFGRSMTGALLASRLGLDLGQMKHIFIVGDLKRPGSTQTEWRFHVAFVAPDQFGELWAFDPIIPERRPVPLSRWIQFVQFTWDELKEAKLYLTSATAVMPNSLEIIKKDRDYPLLIDLDFEPQEHEGFALEEGLVADQQIHILSSAAEQEHFLTIKKGDRSPFSLTELHFIDGPHISFNGYFSDLLDSFSAINPQSQSQSLPLPPDLGGKVLGGLSNRIFIPRGSQMNRCEKSFFPRVF